MGEATEIVSGGTPKTDQPEYWEGGDVPWLTPADLSGYSAKYIERGKRDLTKAGLRSSSAKLMPSGSVLFSSRAPIGYVAIAGNPISTNQGFKSFVPPPDIESDYLYHYLKRAKSLAVDVSSGTTFREVSKKRAASIPLAVAPLPEQRRIVDKIEELFSELDAGVEALERAQTRLERYRASVLQAAVEGRLTVRWRAENPPEETGEELLERIRAERRKRWEEEYRGKYEAKGKKPPKGWKDRYKHPEGPDTSELPDLPEAWCWASLHQLCNSVTDGDHQAPPQTEVGVPFLVIGDVRDGTIPKDMGTRRVPPTYYEDLKASRKPSQGDILYTVTGSYGIPVLVTTSEPFCVQRHIAILKPNEVLSAELLTAFLGSRWALSQADAQATGTAQKTVGLRKLREFSIPLPPLSEQQELSRSLASLEVWRDASTRTMARALTHASGALRQAILKRAFEGRLVPQDPSDEPASALLERIQAERDGSSQQSLDV